MTFEQANAAAQAVRAKYREQKPSVDDHLTPAGKLEVESLRGDPDRAFAQGAVTVDETYVTPSETPQCDRVARVAG